jgi:hypothetical protein
MNNGTFSNNEVHDPEKFREACEKAVEEIKREARERERQLRDPNSIQSLLKRLRKLVDMKFMREEYSKNNPIQWEPFKTEDKHDFRNDAWRTWGHLWREDQLKPRDPIFPGFDFPVHPNTDKLNDDPVDWVDSFAKHIELEALLDE